jgi:hypothetical protein
MTLSLASSSKLDGAQSQEQKDTEPRSQLQGKAVLLTSPLDAGAKQVTSDADAAPGSAIHAPCRLFNDDFSIACGSRTAKARATSDI